MVYIPRKVAEVEEHCGEGAGADMGQRQGGVRFPKSFSSTQAGSMVIADMAHQTHASEGSEAKKPA